MGNDLESYRASIGHFYIRFHSVFLRKAFFRLNKISILYELLKLFIKYSEHIAINCYFVYLEIFLQKPVSVFVILLLILLSNDVEQNPGPPLEGELSIFHLNARSMRHKLDYIDSVCNEADIICLTETHLDASVTNDDIFIEGYEKNPFRKDRNSSGGGVIVYVSDILQVLPRPDLDFDSEIIRLELVFPTYKLLFCVVYRQQNDNYPFWNNFQQSIENALNYSPYLVITGDIC